MKYLTATQAQMGGRLKVLNLASTIASLFGRLTVSISCGIY